MQYPPADPAIGRLIEIAAREMALGMTIVEAPSGRVLYRNPAADRVLGAPAPTEAFDLLGQRIAPEAWPGLRALDGSIVVGERMEVIRGGQRRTISVDASPVRDTDGRIIAGVVTYSDVTEARRAEDAAIFLAAAGALLERFDPELTLQRIAELAVPRLADWCFVHLVQNGEVYCVAMAAADVIKLPAARGGARGPQQLHPDSPIARVLAGGPRELLQVDDALLRSVARDEHHLAGMRSRGYRSTVVAPLTGRGGVLGAITFAMTDSTRSYAEDDLDMLVEIARRTGIALDNARLFAAEQEARRRAEEARDRMRRLQQLTARLSLAVDPLHVARTMVDAGRDALGADGGVAWMLSADRQRLEMAAHELGEVPRVRDRFQVQELTEDLPTTRVVRDGRALLYANRDELEHDYPGLLAAAGSVFHAWAFVPLHVRGQPVGVLTLPFLKSRSFTDDDRALIDAMIGQASLALERATLFDEVRAKQDQLQHALAAARAATWSVDLKTMTSVRDDSYMRLLGLDERHVHADYQSVHPDDRQTLISAVERTVADDSVFEPEVRMQRGDGTYLWTRAHGRVSRDDQGTALSLAGVIVDIDEAKRASLRAEDERRVTETLNRLGMSFASELDHERLAQKITDEVTALVGAAYGVFFYDVAGRQALSLHPITSGDPEGARRLFTPGAAPLLRITTLGRELVRRDDALVEGIRSYLAVPIVAGSGEMFGSLLFGHPEPHRFTPFHEQLVASIAAQAGIALENARLYGTIRDQKNQLELAVARAQLADRRKDEFLAMLGHELRNPLAPISTALELMELKANGAMQRERDVIRRQVTHMTRLVDDLLDVSRITRGKIELSREIIEVGAVIAKAVEMVSPLLEKRGQRLVLEVPQAGLHVDGDATRLAQVFQNLLTNAAKYSDQGKTIVIRARATDTRIAIEVIDQGIGIPPELLSRLFDLFVQGERAIDRSQGGLGIGLTLARSLAELHGGTIEAASPGRDQGSTFTVWLPRADALRVAPQPPEMTRAALTMSGLRVLIVDDNVDAAHTLHELLSALGHDSVLAHDGPSALKLASTFKPEVAVLDIGLPVMDGLELARRLREVLGDPKLRLIAVTGYGQESDRLRVRDAGFDHHLVKPVALDQLVPLIGS